MNSPIFAFLRLFLPLAALIGFGAYIYIDSHRDAKRVEVFADESLSVGLAAAMLDRRMQVVLDDLNYLARHNAIQSPSEPGGALDLRHMARDFVDLLRTKPVYDQMRWIDASGQEMLRVGLKDGQAVVVPQEQLQNKGDRYYFVEAMRLNAGQVYVSPIDLNVERGAIEVPYKPMLRLAMPVADARGEKRGIIILNYLADEMIAYLEAVTTKASDHLMVVNTEGYFIHAPDPADEWGFMFNDAQRSLSGRFPDAWARISQEGRGQFVDAQGLWTFQTVYPLHGRPSNIEAIRTSSGSTLSEAERAHHWQVVSRLTPAQLAELTASEDARIFLYMFFMLAIFAAVALAMVRAGVRERRAEHRFKVYFDRATVGMAMTSPDKQWLAVNPALCRILGYPAELLVSKTWEDLTHPDDVAANVAQFERVLRGELEGYELEKRFIRADGQVVDTFIATQVVRQSDGRPDYFMVIVEDISQRIAAQKQKQQSLETLARFIDHLPGLAYIKDHESRLLVANRGFENILGLLPQDLIGRKTEEIFPGEEGKKIAVDDRRIIDGAHAEVIEETIRGRIYETIKFPIPHDNAPPELGGITIDITARKEAEQMLEMQARRATALLALPQKSVEFDESAFMGYVLDLAEELTGSQIGFMHFVNPDEESIELVAWSTKTLDKYCQAAFDCHYPITKAGIWADAARQKKPVVINDYAAAENKGGLPAGHSALLRLISIPVLEEGVVRMMTGVGNKATPYSAKDVETVQLLSNEAWRIVRRQRAEKALQIANQVVNASPVVCFRWAASEGWPVVFVSENVRQWGYPPADLQAGHPPFADLIHPDDLPRAIDDMISKTAAGLAGYEQEYRIVTPENRSIWVVDRTKVQRDADGKVLFYDGVLTDITERKTQQLAIARNLAEQRELNRRLEEAHNQLLQSEKMASIGQLAAGIAHELNNPIGFVHSNLGTLDGYVRDLMDIIAAYEALANTEGVASPQFDRVSQMREDRDFNYIREDIGQLMVESKDGLARVRKIVLDLKSFAHVSEQEWQLADLHQGLDSTLNIVWNEIKYKCKVVKLYGELPKVNCMISQLNQVFLNLLVNASHAIEKQGTITLRTCCLGDNEVCIEVIDSGNGIAPEHMTRIFEPFFTTKPVGKGTGLGLSLSYGIIDKHHGRIEVDSTLGQGTTFRVIIPINQEAGAAGPSPEAFA